MRTNDFATSSTLNRRTRASALALANLIVMAGAAQGADDTSSSATSSSSSSSSATKPAKKAAVVQPATTDTTNLDEVVVTAQKNSDSYLVTHSANGKYTESLLNTAQTITIVPQALIKDQNATSLKAVLANVPGISLNSGEGQTLASDNLTIRGFNASRDLFVDGVRDTGAYNRDPFNLQEVEVIKGPASTYSGHGSTGGSVDMITKEPSLTPSYNFSSGFGTNQFYRDTVDLNQPLTGVLDNAAIRFNGMYQSNNFAALDFQYASRWGFNPVFEWGLGTDTRVTASYFYQAEQNQPSFGLPVVNAAAVVANPNLSGSVNHVAPVDYSNYYGVLNRDFENTTTQIPTVRFDHDFNDDWHIRNTSRYENTLRQSAISPPRFDAPVVPNMVTEELRARHQTDYLWDNITELKGNFKTWGIQHDTVTTIEFSKEGEDYRTYNGPNLTTNLYDPNPYQAYPFPMENYGPETNTTLDDAAFSFFDTIKFTPQWQLTGSFRYDHIYESSDTPAGLTNGTGAPVATSNFSRVDNLASWRIALAYKPVEYGTIYFGYGTSYDPSIEGVSNSSSPSGLTAASSTLAPEFNQSFELGTKWDLLNEKLSLTGAMFRTNKTNARVTDPSLPPPATMILGGVSQVQGLEAGVAGHITENLQVFGGYALMKSEILSGPPGSFVGNQLPNVPMQTASMWVSYKLPYNLTIGTGGQFVDKRYASTANTNVANGYATQQVMVGYKVTKNFDVQMNIYNLWNTDYIQAVGSNFLPGAGRSFVFTGNVHF